MCLFTSSLTLCPGVGLSCGANRACLTCCRNVDNGVSEGEELMTERGGGRVAGRQTDAF